LEVSGRVAGEPQKWAVKTQAGAEWGRMTVRVPAFEPGTAGMLKFALKLPAGATVCVDDISFRPVP